MIRPVLVSDFDHEMAVTRHLLERCPSNFEWTPHPKSFTLGGLATHLTRLPRWGEWILSNDGFDLVLDHRAQSEPMGNIGDVLDAFDRGVSSVRERLVALSDAEIAAPWALRRNGDAIMTLPRASAFRTFVINHTIHHRGQLSVYLRLLDVALPAIYGPTADEPM